MFDSILLSVLIVGCGLLLSWLFDYDGYSRQLDKAYAQYESQYSVIFDISQAE